MSTVAVPMHPEAVPQDPRSVRWVVPAGLTPFAGEVDQAPGSLGDLLRDGTLVALTCEPVAVVTTLADGAAWSEHGPSVRAALTGALGSDGWTAKGRARTGDEVLLDLGRELAAGRVGDHVRSHGGQIEVLAADGGVLDVRLSGACRGCAAVSQTLGALLESELRRRYPPLVAVRHVDG